MPDQASSLRVVAEEQRMLAHSRSGPPRCRVITVTGGKGGVGKTTFAVNLALALQGMGRRTLLMDADVSLANADVMLNLSPAAGLHNVLRGETNLEGALAKGPLGLTVLPGGSGLSEFANLGSLQLVYLMGELRGLEQEFDYLIVDTPAGIGSSVISFCQYASDVVIVSTPEPTAMLDAYGLLKAISAYHPQGRLQLVVNMVRSDPEGLASFESLQGTVKRYLGLNLEYLSALPADAGVARGVRSQVPFYLQDPQSVASKRMRRIAGILLQQAPAGPDQPSFFANLVGSIGAASDPSSCE